MSFSIRWSYGFICFRLWIYRRWTTAIRIQKSNPFWWSLFLSTWLCVNLTNARQMPFSNSHFSSWMSKLTKITIFNENNMKSNNTHLIHCMMPILITKPLCMSRTLVRRVVKCQVYGDFNQQALHAFTRVN